MYPYTIDFCVSVSLRVGDSCSHLTFSEREFFLNGCGAGKERKEILVDEEMGIRQRVRAKPDQAPSNHRRCVGKALLGNCG